MKNMAVDQFSMGLWVAMLAALVAMIGVMVCVGCGVNAASARSQRSRVLWMVGFALTFGLISAWLPQVIGAAGLSIEGTRVRYDYAALAGSVAIPIVAGFVAVLILNPAPTRHGRHERDFDPIRAIPAIVLLWAGLVGMHALLSYSIQLRGVITFDYVRVGLAGGFALIAAVGIVLVTVFTGRRPLRLTVAVLVSISIAAIHYVGLSGISVVLSGSGVVPGVEVFDVLIPALAVGQLVINIPVALLVMAPGREAAHMDAVADELAKEEFALAPA
jgi:hypothetical protein